MVLGQTEGRYFRSQRMVGFSWFGQVGWFSLGLVGLVLRRMLGRIPPIQGPSHSPIVTCHLMLANAPMHLDVL